MTEFTMTIGGTSVGTGAAFPVINPATEEVIADAPDCAAEDLDEAMNAAARAFPAWRQDESLRRAALKECAQVLAGAEDELAALLTAEQGKPLQDARLEVLGSSMCIADHAELEIPREILQDDGSVRVEVVRRPMGVVAAITPWNFPLILACWKLGPALLAGNTVVLKPSPFTPLTTLKLGELVRDVLPPGVLNIVSGGDSLGALMTAHPIPRKITFTGSVATGKKVAAAAAPDLKRVTLELGGNDPAIVLDDVDAETIADGLFWGAFANCGQICCAVKRVYIAERVYDDVVEALVARARAVKVGDGRSEGTQLGPINNLPQYERVQGLVADALASGASAVAGGKVMDGKGYFFEPTILINVEDGVRIVDEEQFGPVLPLIPYRDLDGAVARANATHFGLGASVWTTDPDRGAQVMSQLDCGTVWVNTHTALVPRQPFGGAKWSGYGVEGGPWGVVSFTDLQVLHQAT